MVDADEILCEIVDPSTVWAELAVPERELARVRAGQQVVVTADTHPELELAGRIDSIAPEIDPHTRTATARVRLENPDGALRANLFVRARILLGREQARVHVPRSALQLAKGVELVFVELTPGTYEVRRVRARPAAGDLVALDPLDPLNPLYGGVEPGERVVCAGSFLLKTETLKGEIGAGCCAEE
jgi:cobalt-zinc-cadmium efflux system membrane fusion protein